MADSNIDFEQLGIGKVLKNFKLAVPAYQRDYSWDAEYVESYLQDLSHAISQDEETYFLGSIVVISRSEGVIEVVDGQQRLATTSMLLAAIRQLNEKGSDIHRALDSFIVSTDLGSMNEPKMALNSSDVSVFSALVSEGETGEGFVDKRASHKRLKKAYDLCKAHIQNTTNLVAESQKSDVYERWIKYLEFKTRIILIKVSTELNAFRMFETLNDRGLKVSQADLIKNFLFSLSDTKLETAKHSWATIKGTLESIDDKEIMMNFIRHALMATSSFVQRKDIYKAIQREVKGENSSIDMLSRLESLAANYVAIFNPEDPFWRDYPHAIKEHIKVIKLFNIQPLKPLLIASTKIFDTKECELLFRYAISMSVRLTLASASRPTSMAVEKPIAEVAQKIWRNELSKASEVSALLAKVIPNDSVFKDEFLSATVSKSVIARYYLRALERTHKNEDEPSHMLNDDPNSVTLEHVLPQTPTESWSQFTNDEADAYKNRIGNLTLLMLTDNTDISANSFEAKSLVYKNSQFAITEMISEYDKWDVDSISSRQTILCELALKAWPV